MSCDRGLSYYDRQGLKPCRFFGSTGQADGLLHAPQTGLDGGETPEPTSAPRVSGDTGGEAYGTTPVVRSLRIVGSAKAYGRSYAPAKTRSSTLKEVEKHFPELKELAFPPRGGTVELESLRVHRDRVSDVVYKVSIEEKNKIKSKLLRDYPRFKVPKWIVQRRLPTYEEVHGHFLFINRSSHPGDPWGQFGSTKGEILDLYGDELIAAVRERIQRLWDNEIFGLTPEELVSYGYCDVVRTFIKNEPHSKKKFDERRFRLISSCSITEELIHSLVYRNGMEVEINNWHNCPSKPGMGLSLDSQQELLFNDVKPWLDEITSTDVSGWDWNMKRWLFDLIGECHVWQSVGSVEALANLSEIVSKTIHCMCNSIFLTSDGRLVDPGVDGIMKSGLVVTAYFNSKGRWICAVLTGSDRAITMGDDCGEDGKPEGMAARYAVIGIKVSDIRLPDGESFSFCSHTFRGGKAIPENPFKALYNLCSSPGDASFLSDFSREMRNHPRLDEFVSVYLAARA